MTPSPFEKMAERELILKSDGIGNVPHRFVWIPHKTFGRLEANPFHINRKGFSHVEPEHVGTMLFRISKMFRYVLERDSLMEMGHDECVELVGQGGVG